MFMSSNHKLKSIREQLEEFSETIWTRNGIGFIPRANFVLLIQAVCCVFRILRPSLGSVVQNVTNDKAFSTTGVKMGCGILCVGYFVYFFFPFYTRDILKNLSSFYVVRHKHNSRIEHFVAERLYQQLSRTFYFLLSPPKTVSSYFRTYKKYPLVGQMLHLSSFGDGLKQ